MATSNVELRVLAGSWRRRYKDEDKEVVTERFVRGDTVSVPERDAKKLLADNSAGRRNFAKVDSDEDPFRDDADDEDGDPTPDHESTVQTSQEGKPAGSSMPRSAPVKK
jgi:hypothetical protein